MLRFGTIHLRRRHFLGGRGVSIADVCKRLGGRGLRNADVNIPKHIKCNNCNAFFYPLDFPSYHSSMIQGI